MSQRIERVRLGNGATARNPRAVWVNLDELTAPSPESESFYSLLGERIVGLGVEAGLAGMSGELLTRRLRERSAHYSKSINVGTVREFVKLAASMVAQEVSRNV